MEERGILITHRRILYADKHYIRCCPVYSPVAMRSGQTGCLSNNGIITFTISLIDLTSNETICLLLFICNFPTFKYVCKDLNKSNSVFDWVKTKIGLGLIGNFGVVKWYYKTTIRLCKTRNPIRCKIINFFHSLNIFYLAIF